MKQTWVENVKIKSKWKAEKRKLGLTSGQSVADTDLNPDLSKEDEDTESWHGVDEEVQDNEGIEESMASTASTSALPRTSQPQQPNRSKQKEKNPTPATETRSLRDLTRDAYSRSSLHTYKSGRSAKDGSRDQTRRGHNRGGGGRGRGQPGRGQPNMKLRMDVMLEKIKRDFAP